MDKVRHKRNYDLHSWVGIVLGVLVYVVCFTGSVALFDHEIKTWEDPAKRLPLVENPIAITETYEAWIAETANGNETTFQSFEFPTQFHPHYGGGVTVREPILDAKGEPLLLPSGEPRTRGKFYHTDWNAETGEELTHREGGLSEWLLDFHRDFMWPDGFGGRTIGRSLVGVVGIILLLAIISGIVAHTKIREEAYSMRLKRSQRLKWQDSHKVVGLWGLPFSLMIAFTGAWLGVIVLLSQLVAVLAFKGDTEALFAAVLGEEAKPTGVQAQMLSMEELRDIRYPDTGEHPYLVTMSNYGDEAAEFELFYEAKTKLVPIDGLHISGVTGEVLHTTDEEATPAIRVAGAMTPLHYGTYGGIWLKFLYFALGLSVAVVTALGCMMWIERRKHGNEGTKTEGFYNRLGHINTGIIMGLPLATLSIFYLDKLYTGAEASRLVTTGWTYFGVWAIGLAYAFIRKNDYATTRELLMASGAIAMLIPVLNGMTTGDWFITALAGGHTAAAWVDVFMLVVGALTILAGYLSPAARKAKRVSRTEVDTPESAATVPAE